MKGETLTVDYALMRRANVDKGHYINPRIGGRKIPVGLAWGQAMTLDQYMRGEVASTEKRKTATGPIVQPAIVSAPPGVAPQRHQL